MKGDTALVQAARNVVERCLNIQPGDEGPDSLEPDLDTYDQQLMTAVGSEDGREIVLELEELRQTGRLVRDPADGRYSLKCSKAPTWG